MKKIIDYLLSAIYLLYFGLILLIFHPIQLFFFHFFGQRVHQRSVHVMNFFLLYGLYLMGINPRFRQKEKLPTDRPLILIANHQSMHDIIGIIWFLRNNFPVFVSKIELSKGIPSISYNLRKSGAALIDRKDTKQATVEIAHLGKMIEQTKFSAAIFPEGTRSRTGMLKPFAVGGVAVLMKKSPSALILPIAIEGRMNPEGFFPLNSFTKLRFSVLETIERGNLTSEEVVQLAESRIKEALGQ